MNCIKCQRELSGLDIPLHKKMINRGAKEFMCMNCLAAYLNVSTDLLLEKAEQFKKQGCTLFL